MQLKNVIDMPCGLRFMLDELQLQSGYARRFLLDSHMMTSSEQLRVSYEVLKQFSAFVNSIDKSRLNTLLFRLQGVKDINTTNINYIICSTTKTSLVKQFLMTLNCLKLNTSPFLRAR